MLQRCVLRCQDEVKDKVRQVEGGGKVNLKINQECFSILVGMN